jgi:hypothetical protein
VFSNKVLEGLVTDAKKIRHLKACRLESGKISGLSAAVAREVFYRVLVWK